MQERRAEPPVSPVDVDRPAGWRLGPVLPVAVAVVAVDQATKWWALRSLDDRTIDLFWTVRLNLVFNRGGAFGLGSRYAPLIALCAALVVAFLLRSTRALDGVLPRLAVGLVAGGAIGNLADRVLREGEGFLGGAVVDFFDVQWWPVFNAADAAISVGAVLLALTVWTDDRARAC